MLACLDVIINERLMKYCLQHELISDAQYGFIRGRNCEVITRRVVETVEHCLCVCPLYSDLRTDMLQKLTSKLSPGLLIDLDHPTDNPQLWTQVLLQARVLPCWAMSTACLSVR